MSPARKPKSLALVFGVGGTYDVPQWASGCEVSEIHTPEAMTGTVTIGTSTIGPGVKGGQLSETLPTQVVGPVSTTVTVTVWVPA